MSFLPEHRCQSPGILQIRECVLEAHFHICDVVGYSVNQTSIEELDLKYKCRHLVRDSGARFFRK